MNAFELFADGPRIHEFLAEMHREVFGGREGKFLTVGEMPGVTTEEAVLYTDPARGEVDMVFQFEHVSIDHGGNKWDYIGLDRVALKQSLHRWQVALADAAGTASTGTTTTSPAPSRASATTTPSTGPTRPRRSPRSSTACAARRTCTRGRSSG